MTISDTLLDLTGSGRQWLGPFSVRPNALQEMPVAPECLLLGPKYLLVLGLTASF
jgi:hypothetical protein